MAYISMYFFMVVIFYIYAKFVREWSTWYSLIFSVVAATIAGIPLIIAYFV